MQSGFELRELYRTLTSTQAYQRTSQWTQRARTAGGAVRSHAGQDAHRRAALRFGKSRAAPPAAKHDGGRNVNSPLLDPQRQAFIAKVQSSGRNFLEYQAGVLQALSLLNGSDLAEATDPERARCSAR